VLRIDRLRTSVRVTYAFHARELRFEADRGEGFVAMFPETFSFHVEKHDPTELYLQLEDLWTRPRLLGPNASRRDAEAFVRRLVSGLPGHLERVLDRLELSEKQGAGTLARVHEDLVVLSMVVLRFLGEKDLEENPPQRLAGFHLRKLLWRAASGLVKERVGPEALQAYRDGRFERPGPGEDASETTLIKALAGTDPAVAERQVLIIAERAYHGWVEDVCLDEANGAFEGEESPFLDRESEVLWACKVNGDERLLRGRDLSPFLRRSRNKDCMRLLDKVKRYFLRQYDVVHSSLLIHHMSFVATGRDDSDRILTRHSALNYGLALLALCMPFIAASVAYDRAPFWFDLVVAAEVAITTTVGFWYLLVQFAWKRDLTLFFAGVPRIGAGIIVGYLPVFLIDEVWSLSLKAFVPLGAVAVLLAFTTLLYLYVEVQRRLGESAVAFRRARAIFLLGLLQAFVFGLIATSMIGRFMAERVFTEDSAASLPFEAIRSQLPQFAGELPRIMGIEPFLAFPTAVFLMTFLSIFIGTFLQLLWEDLPITEPL
jgi:hypothetical protein